MPPPRKLRLLHISDLHLGKEKAASDWRIRRVLGKAWAKNLSDIAADGPIDLVCFTGDIAQSGQPAQYEEATRFIDELLGTLKVPRERFFCVPGNHDVDRNVNAAAWKKLRDASWAVPSSDFARFMAKDGHTPFGCKATWPDQVIARQAAYHNWLQAIGREALQADKHPHGRLGYRVALDLGLGAPLHIVGLDSAWLAGDDNDASKLRLTDEQLGRLLGAEGLPGWTIALLHHPLGDIADGKEAERQLAALGVGLVLHGHQHDPHLVRWTTPAGSAMHVSATGCLYETDRYPNSLQVLDIELPPLSSTSTSPQTLQPLQLWARAWSGRGGGHWHNDNSLYPGSTDGRLPLGSSSAPPQARARPLRPQAGYFVGRDAELRQMREALLPADGGTIKPTVVCCVIEGMPGVGKTRLAEQFLRQHWLPAVGLPGDARGDALDAHLVRLVLGTEDTPGATRLGQQIADRLRTSGDPNTLWERLKAELQSGPRLLLIENVDTEALASTVAQLVAKLPGCVIVVTARIKKLGGKGWLRVPVPPLALEQARELLLAETDQVDGYRLTATEADRLANELGRLPLALHIAASHLSQGMTPDGFLGQLKRLGMNVGSADVTDWQRTTEGARAILQSSFELSWQHWCDSKDIDDAWPNALVALAHGPAAAVGLKLGAAICGLADKAAVSAFATKAARLSLLDFKEGRLQLHPLIAELLRNKSGPTADVVLERMTSWFDERLANASTPPDMRAPLLLDVAGEAEAMKHWLSRRPFDATPILNTAQQEPLKVFLCHASEDKDSARKLYRRLRQDGYEPWLDEEDLIAGQKWEVEIPRAVRNANVVLVCLSARSISKTGYVQREIKFALDAALEQPEESIYIIPVRLEACAVPNSLSPWQWLDYFAADGYERLRRALDAKKKQF